MKNDWEIWEEFKNGNDNAISYIYFQNFRLMFQYGIKFKEDPDFIKDCIQDVFFKLIKSADNLGQTGNIRFYLFKALKNTILKNIESERRVGLVDLDSLKFDAHFIMEDELQDKEQISAKEKALINALKTLSDRQREIIYLRFECGMEYEQICEIMQLKSDSARKLVFRAIKSLREVIEGQIQSPILFFLRFSEKHVF